MFGLNKPRTRLGSWMDQRGVKQQWLMKTAGVNKLTVSKACNEDDYLPSGSTMQKIIKALRKIDPTVNASDFWDV